MIVKDLKCDKRHFWDVWTGKKKSEVRYNDREYKVGDFLLLRETVYSEADMNSDLEYPLIYTDREILVKVTHILRDTAISAALREDWCVMSIEVLAKISPSGE